MELYGINFNEKNISDVFDIVSKHKACVKEEVFKKYFKELYNDLCLINYPDDFVFSQKLYHFLRNDNNLELGICPVCGNRTKFLGFTKGYRTYCNSKCMGNDEIFWKKHRDTNLEKYGFEFASQSEIVKDKIKKTNLDKYGYEFTCQSEIVKDKIKKTKLDKYGDSGYNNSNKISETWKNKFENENIVEERKNRYFEKTGYDNPFQNPEIKEKIKKTNIDKYGYECSSKNIEIRKKISDTKLSYSDDDNRLINAKRKETCLKLYGVDTISKLDRVKEKSKNTRHTNTLNKYENVIDIVGNTFVCKCVDELCDKCENKQFEINRYIYKRRCVNNEELCTIKNPINYSSSNEEKEFKNFISSIYNGEIIMNDRKSLDGMEIDIYLPDLNIGFEFNGIYFHSELFKENNYHQNKSLKAREKNIKLIQIWEDDWYSKTNIVKSIIKSKLGIFENKIWARKCEIREVRSKESKIFLDNNHLQGNVTSSIKLGLYYENELVCLCTFGKLRKFMKSSSMNGEYELYRFCSKCGYQIVGGFQKLLKYFIQTYNPIKIITYASLDISNGNVYENSGFKFIKITSPGYTWANDTKENKELYCIRKHRFNFKKSDLVKLGYDKNNTENEIMHSRNYFKCYDSGNLLYEMRFT